MTHGCLKVRLASYSSKYRAPLRYLNKLKKKCYNPVRLDILWGFFFLPTPSQVREKQMK